LNRVAIDLGFIHQASAPAFKILPNYSLPFLNNPAIGKIAAGLLGALLVGALVVLILRRSRSESTRDSK
jgi:cobalt/nickel transport system permease protein